MLWKSERPQDPSWRLDSGKSEGNRALLGFLNNYIESTDKKYKTYPAVVTLRNYVNENSFQNILLENCEKGLAMPALRFICKGTPLVLRSSRMVPSGGKLKFGYGAFDFAVFKKPD